MANGIHNAKRPCLAVIPDRPPAGRGRRLRAGASLAVFACLALNAAALAQTPAETITYTYDALGRLTNVAHAGTVNNNVNAAYTLDAAGNRSNVPIARRGPPIMGKGSKPWWRRARLPAKVTAICRVSHRFSSRLPPMMGRAGCRR